MNRKNLRINILFRHKLSINSLLIIKYAIEPLMTYAYSRTLMSNYVPTHYRTHTLGEIQTNGAKLIDSEVVVAGFMEANRGKGAICFVDLRDGTGKTQLFLKSDNVG